MATPISANRGHQLHGIKGLTGSEIGSLKGDSFVAKKSSLIESKVKAGLSRPEARDLLSSLKVKIKGREGFLKLMHTEHSSKTLSFETKSGISSFFTRNERRSETEGALKGAFRALGLNDEQFLELNQMLDSHSKDAHLEVKDVVPIIEKALEFFKAKQINPFPEPKTPANSFVKGPIVPMSSQGKTEENLCNSLTSFRKIKIGDTEVGGSARPAGSNLKHEATVSNVLKDIQEAGFTHILSLDQSDRPAYTELKEEIQNTFLTHLQPSKLNIKDEVDDGESKDLYEGSQKLSVDSFEALKSEVDKVAAEGGKVLIHCGAGAGRTGTMLASLVLADLVSRRANDYLPNKSGLYPIQIGNKTFGTTPLVRLAIETVRQADKSFTGNGFSVESERELKLLQDYEKALLKNPVL